MVIWELVAPPLVGGVLALVGVWFTRRGESQRLKTAVEAERKREDARWQKENRKHAYESFRREAQRLSGWMAMYTRVGLASAEAPQADWLLPLNDLASDVRTYGSDAAIAAAEALRYHASRLGSGTIGDMMRFDVAMYDYTNAVRVDLGLTPITPRPAGFESMTDEEFATYRERPDDSA